MNCKPGDLAIIVQDVCPQNVGIIVEIESAYGEYLDFGFCWNVRASRPIAMMDASVGWIYQGSWGWHPDAWLRPVSGLPITDDITDEVTA
ncbi:hypothetical protein KTD31_17240 [Burkholderia multivorans]|uniref:hypothetical protein n=1 Tax=Burkholderia multivorans TaxID=87883 RepID=UPI0009BD6E90|nr:hypothetical protein [Burkholderia multivorans]MBU9203103.1 hypothetical protein [Burkholderia multivorans]MCA8385342.1 hypothetical protein [Burkholderia multivorans]